MKEVSKIDLSKLKFTANKNCKLKHSIQNMQSRDFSMISFSQKTIQEEEDEENSQHQTSELELNGNLYLNF